jgi:hypothetical protein
MCRDSCLPHGVHSSYGAHMGYRGCFSKGKAVGARWSPLICI